jgi:hypothetical protein
MKDPMLSPIITPEVSIPALSSKAAVILTAISGRDVPIDTIVKPTSKAGKRTLQATLTEQLTIRSDPNHKPARPAAINPTVHNNIIEILFNSTINNELIFITFL